MFDFSTPITRDIYLKASYNCAPPQPDPSNPTLSNLKTALSFDNPASIYPVGTEIPDQIKASGTWRSSPWIVGQYLTNTSPTSTYLGQTGVLLIRKYVDYTHKMYVDGSASSTLEAQYYSQSDLRQWLLTTYFNDYCTEELKNIVDEFTFGSYGRNGNKKLTDKLFLPGSAEVWGLSPYTIYVSALGGSVNANGQPWKYWTDRTNLTDYSRMPNSKRIITSPSGTTYDVWLRDTMNSTTAGYTGIIKTTGAITTSYFNVSNGIIVCCFISKT